MKIKHYSFILMGILTGCAVGPDFHSPEALKIVRYTAEPLPPQTVATNVPGGQAQYFIEGQTIPEQWWQVFQSPVLDQLIKQGLSNSPTLIQAKARLKQAQEDFNTQFGQSMLPTIDGNASVTRERFNIESFGITAFPNPPPFTLYNIGTTVSYTLDVFGANRRELEALCASVDYQRYELLASQLALTANIVTAAIRYASLNEQIKTTQEIIDLQENQLSVTEKRYHAGGVSQIDIQNQQSLLAQTRADLAPLEKQREQTKHQLAVYVGQMPSEAEIPLLSLKDFQLPTDLPISLPYRLLRQRPDIQASEALLHEASANVGVATANLYPKITITGSLATEANVVNKLFSAGTSAWNIGPGLTQPLFHGGALRAKRRSAIAAFDQAKAAYQETVLQGIQNVADSLKAIEYDAKTLQARSNAALQAKDTYQITQRLYAVGGVSYLSMLDAQRQYHQTQLLQIQSTADRYADTAGLFQALGGGW